MLRWLIENNSHFYFTFLDETVNYKAIRDLVAGCNAISIRIEAVFNLLEYLFFSDFADLQWMHCYICIQYKLGSRTWTYCIHYNQRCRDLHHMKNCFHPKKLLSLIFNSWLQYVIFKLSRFMEAMYDTYYHLLYKICNTCTANFRNIRLNVLLKTIIN